MLAIEEPMPPLLSWGVAEGVTEGVIEGVIEGALDISKRTRRLGGLFHCWPLTQNQELPPARPINFFLIFFFGKSCTDKHIGSTPGVMRQQSWRGNAYSRYIVVLIKEFSPRRIQSSHNIEASVRERISEQVKAESVNSSDYKPSNQIPLVFFPRAAS